MRFVSLWILALCTLLNVGCSGPEPSDSEFSGDVYSVGAADMFSVKDADPINITLDLPDGGRLKWTTKWETAKSLDPADVVIKRRGDTRVAVFRDGKQLTDSPFLTESINRDQYWKPTANYGSPIAGMDPKVAHEKVSNEKKAEAEKAFRAGDFKGAWSTLLTARSHLERALPADHPRLKEIERQIEAVRARIKE